MTLRISGKNFDVGDALRSQIDDRIEAAVGKYFDGGHSGHIVLEREGSGIKAECTVHLDTGVVLQAEGKAQEARSAFDLAADRIEKRLRRYKRRLKDRAHAPTAPAGAADEATDRVFAVPADDEEIDVDYSPVTIAEETTSLRTLSVSAAVISLDMSDKTVLVFKNAGHGGINVVYRRPDGNIGWVDPMLPGSGNSS